MKVFWEWNIHDLGWAQNIYLYENFRTCTDAEASVNCRNSTFRKTAFSNVFAILLGSEVPLSVLLFWLATKFKRAELVYVGTSTSCYVANRIFRFFKFFCWGARRGGTGCGLRICLKRKRFWVQILAQAEFTPCLHWVFLGFLHISKTSLSGLI